MVKTIRDFLKKDFGVAGAKTVRLGPGDYLKVVITTGFGYIRGGALYTVRERKRSSDVLELVGVMPMNEIREYNLRKQRKVRR